MIKFLDLQKLNQPFETQFLFKTKDPQDLARQVFKLITDADLRKQMGKVSLEKIKQYDIHKSVDLLEKVYYSAIKK